MWFSKKDDEDPKLLFSDQWMKEWKEAINQSESYRITGVGWNEPLVLKFNPVPDYLQKTDSVGIYLDLSNGVCNELRYANSDDVKETNIVLSASEESWIYIIRNRKDPMYQMMKGKIKAEKGGLVKLSTHHKSARALLECAPFYDQLPSDSVPQTHTKEPAGRVKKRIRFKTTSKGLDFESFPMQLFQKSKILGIWNPADINLDRDIKDWENLNDEEKRILTHLFSLFMAGEEAVTLNLLPLIQTVAGEGRIEEEIYLTSFLWEEAKHTEFFSRVVAGVMNGHSDFESFHGPFYKILFYEKLPVSLSALNDNPSPVNQLKASAVYNMIVEGTLAETGYEAFYKMLEENDLMPGLREGITLLKRDESRHIAFGLYFINRLLDEHPDLRPNLENELETLLNDATNMIHEIFEPYEEVPFGLEKEWFLNYAIQQFQLRMNKLGF